MCFHFQLFFCWLSVQFHFRHCFSLRHMLNALFQHNYRNSIGANFIICSCCHYKFPQSGHANVFLITNNYIVFLYFCFLVPNLILTILIPKSKGLISKELEVNFRKYCSTISPMIANLSSLSSLQAVMDRNCGNVMAFGKFVIPSVIGFTLLTRPSLKCFCISLTGLKSFESSYCWFKSPTRSDRSFVECSALS